MTDPLRPPETDEPYATVDEGNPAAALGCAMLAFAFLLGVCLAIIWIERS